MGFPNIEVNYLAILVAAVVSFVIGMLWYSPILFGNAWMKASGITKKDIEKSKKKGMGKQMITAFISSLVMAYVLAIFVKLSSAASFIHGVKVGFWLWLGFVATIALGSILWEGKPFKYYLINVSYWLVNVAIMAGILAVWR
jgi:hypothetical protein